MNVEYIDDYVWNMLQNTTYLHPRILGKVFDWSIGASGVLFLKQTIKCLNNCYLTVRLKAQSLIVAH